MKDYVELEGIDCDFEETRVFDVCLHNAGRDKARSDLASIAQANITTMREIEGHFGDDAEEVYMIFVDCLNDET